MGSGWLLISLYSALVARRERLKNDREACRKTATQKARIS